MNIYEELMWHPPVATSLQFEFRKRGKRRIAAPSPELAELHRAFINHLERCMQDFGVTMPSAVGGISGWSPKRNVLVHSWNHHFYVIDFKNAFPSIAVDTLAEVIRNVDPLIDSMGDLTEFLERYFVLPGEGLVQGGPASPLLFNLYCEYKIDRPIRALLGENARPAERPKIVYTRYIDDLVFSSVTRIPRVLRKKFLAIIRDADFAISTQKTRYLERGKDVVVINGVRLMPHGGLCLTHAAETSLKTDLREYLLSARRPLSPQLAGRITWYEHIRPDMPDNRTRRCLDRLVRHARARVPSHRKRRKIEKSAYISNRWLYELRRKVDLAAIVGGRVKLKKRTSKKQQKTEYIGLCPFHKEKTPSFTVSVSARRSFFHCFGCGAHGDAIDFVMQTTDTPFRSAAGLLAKDVGMKLPEPTDAPS